MWIEIDKKVIINLDEVETIRRHQLIGECDGKKMGSYYIVFNRAHVPDSSGYSSIIYEEKYGSEEERDIRYEEIKKLLIKVKAKEIY